MVNSERISLLVGKTAWVRVPPLSISFCQTVRQRALAVRSVFACGTGTGGLDQADSRSAVAELSATPTVAPLPAFACVRYQAIWLAMSQCPSVQVGTPKTLLNGLHFTS